VTPPVATDSEPVLVLRAIGLGDALTGVPALRGLRRRFAPRPVLLAAPAALGRWMTDLDVVDGYVPTRDLDDQPPGLALGPHDAVDLHGNGSLSRDLLTAARPRQVLSFAPPDPAAEVPQTWVEWTPSEHEVHRWIRLVAAWGAEATPDDLRLRARPDTAASSGRVIVHPGAAYGSRRWPVDRFAEVARVLAEQGHDVVVTGGPTERILCAEVAERAGLPLTATTAGTLELPQLAGLVRDAALVVCGDTGIAHLATALAVPSVLLFGPVAPSAWGPVIDLDLHTVLWHGDGTGDPHGAEADPHLLQITPDEVLAAADAHFGSEVDA
jgi:ADP-heptose:LPS heptosyltransferase